jgi:hypothetical protein
MDPITGLFLLVGMFVVAIVGIPKSANNPFFRLTSRLPVPKSSGESLRCRPTDIAYAIHFLRSLHGRDVTFCFSPCK